MAAKCKKERLIALGPEPLAEMLLELAQQNKRISSNIDLLLAPSHQRTGKLQTRIAGLKRRSSFVEWHHRADLESELLDLLKTIRTTAKTADEGLELLTGFYLCDKPTLERVDDSNGEIGDIFRYDATELFQEYASKCVDQAQLVSIIEQLVEGNEYSVRDGAVKAATAALAEDQLQELAGRFWNQAEQSKSEQQQRRWYYGIETVAMQLKDAPLYERACLAIHPEASSTIQLQIARAYLTCGNPETALDKISVIHDLPDHWQNNKDDLLFKIQAALGNAAAQAEIAWRIFHRSKSEESLTRLLQVIGAGQRETVLQEAKEEICAQKQLIYSDAHFLLRAGLAPQAEAYLLARREQLNGAFYDLLLPLAQSLEQAELLVGVSILYRAMIDYILQRATSKYYHHAVRYLRKLEKLNQTIENWQGVETHAAYAAQLAKAHMRKRAFWEKYAKPPESLLG